MTEPTLPPFDPELVDTMDWRDGSPLSDFLEGLEVIFGTAGKVLLVVVAPLWLPFYIAGRIKRQRRGAER